MAIKAREWEIYHPENPKYIIAHVDVVSPHWAHIKKDRIPASISVHTLGHGAISVEAAEKLRDALTEAITKAKAMKLEKPAATEDLGK